MSGQQSPFGWIRPLARARYRAVATIAVASTAAGIAEAGVLALIAHLATALSAGDGATEIGFGPLTADARTPILFGFAAALAAIRLGLQLVIARLPARLGAGVMSDLRIEVSDAFLSASWAEQAGEPEGHLQELVVTQAGSAGIAVLHLSNALSAALAFTVLVVSAITLSIGVALSVMATAAVLFSVLRPLSRRVRLHSAAASSSSLAQAAGVAETVRMAEEVQVFGAARAEAERIEALVRRVEQNLVKTWTLSRMVPVIYQSAVIFLLIVGLAFLYASGTEELASLGAVVLILVRASSYGQQLQSAYQGLEETAPYYERVNCALERYRASASQPGLRPLDSIHAIAFDQVSFTYTGDPVLRSVTFSFEAGEAVGVVGPSGSGKSTLVQLLLRLRTPTEGIYLVNGVEAPQLDREAWRRRVAYVPQEPHVLTGTVTENIRFFRRWVSDEDVERSARLAHIHDEIVSWPDGYDTVIGQRVDAVSGGQRQRLCLARALAGTPEMLVLDEPTSALDLQSERAIQRSLEELRGSLTLVIVAHRLTTLNQCDRIMVLRDGVLEGFAASAELYGSNDFYRRAFDLAATGEPRSSSDGLDSRKHNSQPPIRHE